MVWWLCHVSYYYLEIFCYFPGAINYVKGFEIIRVSPGIAATTCYILDLSNVTWKNSIEELSVSRDDYACLILIL